MRLNRISIIFIFKKRISARAFSLSLSFSVLFSLMLLVSRIYIHKIIIVNDVGECKATGIAFLFSAGGSNCLVLYAPSNSASNSRARNEKKQSIDFSRLDIASTDRITLDHFCPVLHHLFLFCQPLSSLHPPIAN